MKPTACAFVWMLICVVSLRAQSYESNPFSRLNSNVALTVGVPLSSMGTYTTPAWGFAYGAGYNISRRHSVIGEVMWNRLLPTSEALAPIRTAAQNNYINGHGNLFALTANYRLQFEGKVFGTYLIAGGGMYYRDASLSQVVVTGDSVDCIQAWRWWGFTCESGRVTSHQTLASSNSTAPGGNVGIGFTVRIPDSEYKFYIESRFHYATNRGVATTIMPIAVGVRF